MLNVFPITVSGVLKAIKRISTPQYFSVEFARAINISANNCNAATQVKPASGIGPRRVVTVVDGLFIEETPHIRQTLEIHNRLLRANTERSIAIDGSERLVGVQPTHCDQYCFRRGKILNGIGFRSYSTTFTSKFNTAGTTIKVNRYKLWYSVIFEILVCYGVFFGIVRYLQRQAKEDKKTGKDPNAKKIKFDKLPKVFKPLHQTPLDSRND